MDRLDAMSMFLSAIEEGSLARAARTLGRSPAAVTRALALLEAQTGERLLHRSSRRLKLTAAGERNAAIYRLVLSELAQIDPAQQESTVVRGSIVVTAPELFGRLNVMPVLEAFLDRHPAASARMLLLNRMTDMTGEGIDVAVRLAPMPDSGLVAIKLGSVQRVVCAAPEYLARNGKPKHPNDLASHQCIGLNEAGDRELWPFVFPDGRARRARSLPVSIRLSLNGAGAELDATLRGQGVGWFLSYQVADDLISGKLVRLLTKFEPAPVPVHLVFHPRPKRGGAIRAFVDMAVPLLRERLTQIERTMR